MADETPPDDAQADDAAEVGDTSSDPPMPTPPAPERLTETSVDIVEADGSIQVRRTAAFAEVATRPTARAIEDDDLVNDVVFYENLLGLDAELAGTVTAMCQLAAMGIDVTHPATEGDDEEMSTVEEDLTQDCQQLVLDTLAMEENAVTYFENLVAHGNDVAHVEWADGEGVTGVTPLPLRALTILDEATLAAGGYEETTFVTEGTTITDTERTIAAADYYLLNEKNEESKQEFPARDILHLAVNQRDHWHTDHHRRATYNIWGRRMLEPAKWAVQAKSNTLANKVAMDDKLLAREVYYIDVETLFGHIQNDDERTDKAKAYAKELKEQIEGLDADEKPVLPREVEVEVIGPSGETSQEMSAFIETCNNSIQHALVFHIAGFGRDAGGTLAGNRPAREASENMVRHLRQVMAAGFRKLFEIHALTAYPAAREPREPVGDDDPGDWEGYEQYQVKDDVVLPVLSFEPTNRRDMADRVKDAVTMYEKGLADLNEARETIDLDPVAPDDIEEMYWYPELTPRTPDEREAMREQQFEREREMNAPDDEMDTDDEVDDRGDGNPGTPSEDDGDGAGE